MLPLCYCVCACACASAWRLPSCALLQLESEPLACPCLLSSRLQNTQLLSWCFFAECGSSNPSSVPFRRLRQAGKLPFELNATGIHTPPHTRLTPPRPPTNPPPTSVSRMTLPLLPTHHRQTPDTRSTSGSHPRDRSFQPHSPSPTPVLHPRGGERERAPAWARREGGRARQGERGQRKEG